MKILWSSRNQKFVGHAMSAEEMSSLCDVYRTLSPYFRQRKTNYVLQTLWRDLTSNFDVIGPHYSSEGTMDVSYFLVNMLHGVKTSSILCTYSTSSLYLVYWMLCSVSTSLALKLWQWCVTVPLPTCQ